MRGKKIGGEDKKKMNGKVVSTVFVVVLCFGLASVALAPAAVAAADWQQFHYDVVNAGNSPSDAPDTNQTRWISANIGAVASTQAMIAGNKVFVYADDKVYALSKATGAEVWNKTIFPASGMWGWQSPGWNDSKVFIGSGTNVWCFNDADGSETWNITLPTVANTPFVVNSAPTVANGLVFIGDYNNSRYYALREADGSINHTYVVGGGNPDAHAQSAVALDETAELVFFGDGGNKTVYCAHKYNSTIKWQHTLDGYVGGSVAVDSANDRVFVTTYGSGVWALDRSTGAEVWKNLTMGGTDSTPAVAYGNVYVSKDNAVSCFNAATGAWQWSKTGWGSWTDSPAVADNKIFVGNVGSWGGNPPGIAALNPTTGAVLWSYGGNAGSPASVAESNGNGLVVTVGSDGKVYAFETRVASCDASGNVKNAFCTGEKVYVKLADLESSTNYKVWIQDEPVNEGYALSAGNCSNCTGDCPGKTGVSVTTNATGYFGPTELWNLTGVPVTYDKYDIVADKQDEADTGKYNSASDGIDDAEVEGFVAPVPEMVTIALFGIGLLMLVGYVGLRRREWTK